MLHISQGKVDQIDGSNEDSEIPKKRGDEEASKNINNYVILE